MSVIDQAIELPYSTYTEERGEIFSFYEEREYKDRFPDIRFVQDRASISYLGTVRGFHGDPHTYKLVTCPIGQLYLCVVNPTTGHRQEFFLSDSSKSSVLIPKGFINAHQCLSHQCMFLYKQSEYYDRYPAEKQWTVRYDDIDISANWPRKPLRVSERDKNGISLKELRNIIDA